MLLRRLPELTVYALTVLGIMLLVGAQSYAGDVINHQETYWEPRYLVPLIPLWGLVAALAARGGGRRWGPLLGISLIVLFLTHDIFSQLQVVARYYG